MANWRSSPLLQPSCLLIYALSLYAGALLVVNMAALPYLAESFALGERALAAMLSALAVGGVLAIVGARLSDRFGRRTMLLRCFLLCAPVVLCSIFAQTLWQYVLLQVLLGGLLATIHITTLVAIEEYLPQAKRAAGQAYVGIAFVLGSGGGLITVNLAAALFEQDSWRYVWAVGLSLSLFYPLAHRFLKETPDFTAAQRLPSNQWRDLFSPALRRNTQILLFGSLCWDLVQCAFAAWLIYHPVQNLGVKHEWVTLYLIVGGWPAMLGFVLGVYLRNILGSFGRAIALCCVVSIAGNFTYYWVSGNGLSLVLILGCAYVVSLLMDNALNVNVRSLINERYPIDLRSSMQAQIFLVRSMAAITVQLMLVQLIVPMGGLANTIVLLLVLKLVAAVVFLGLPGGASRMGSTRALGMAQ